MQINLVNRQRRVRLDARRLARLADASLAESCLYAGDGRCVLKKVALVEIAVVSDAVIARVHRQFMNVPGPTDVFTFEHGEIVVSADTARVQAAEQGHGVTEELALYIIHGLLHLNGWNDIEPRERAGMHRAQERIWRRVLSAEVLKNQPCIVSRKKV